MCKKEAFIENLSADTVSLKNKTEFKRIYTVVLNTNGSGKEKSKNERFKKGIPYLVWATDITKDRIKIREVVGGKSPIEVTANNCRFTSSPQTLLSLILPVSVMVGKFLVSPGASPWPEAFAVFRAL